MADREKVIKGIECCLTLDSPCGDCPYYSYEDIQELDCERNLRHDALALLKDSVSQGVVDQMRWERDTALSQLKEIGKGLGEKMDDIVAMLKEQEAVKLHTIDTDEEQYSFWFVCGNCGWKIYKVVDDENCEDRKQIHFCASCGRPISWEGG